MPKKAGIVLMLAGTVLILSALSLFLYNRNEDNKAVQVTGDLLFTLQSIIAEKNLNESGKSLEEVDTAMTIVDIDGYGYVGYLTIPALELELPIMSDWDYARLKIAPCRQFGSSKSDDLVIAAHNYKNHFGNLSDLKKGDELIFTDMDGAVNTYELVTLNTLSAKAVDAVQNSGHDLVLYTCTYGGKTRVTVFCNRTKDISP